RFTLDKEDLDEEFNLNPNGWNPWSPNGDRFQIYTKEGTLQIWDTQSGENLHTLSGHEGQISQAIWSPSGDLIVTSGFEDGVVILWEAESGEVLHRISADFEDEKVIVGSWSPGGGRFTIRGMGGARVYDTVTGQHLLTLCIPKVWFIRVIWSPDGTRLLTTGRDDGTARVWDAESGQEQSRLAGLVWATGSDWSPVEELAAVGGHDSIVHIWDMVTGQEVDKLYGTEHAANHVAFSPDGERLLTVGISHNVNVYDLSEARINIPLAMYYGITNVAWSPDGKQFAFGWVDSPNDPVKIWEASSGHELMTLSGAGVLSWSPDGDRFLIANDEENTVRIWEAATWELLLTFTGTEDLAGRWLSADCSPDSSQIASNSYDPTVVIWDAITGDEIITFAGHQNQVLGILWSPDGTRILSHGTDGEAIIWETASGKVLHNLFPEEYNLNIAHVAWTKDGRQVVVLSEDGFVTIFDSWTGEQQSQFFTISSGSSLITFFSLSPSEERMLIGGHDGVARVWDLATGTQLLGYEVGGYTTPAYSPDGRWVLIGSIEGNRGKLQVFPTWHSAEELIKYAREHCVFRELTAEERELFGLPERGNDAPS
ncbi:MAG: WD40 repeat domain-containing protein, partial [Anaerolineales bacterium]|nr:WD40 repeat domain-containing protein [Anaerolineales bacterium]